MFLSMKNKILALFGTISEMLAELGKMSNKSGAIEECSAALAAILNQLDKEESSPPQSKQMLLEIQAAFAALYADGSLINDIAIKTLDKQVKVLRETVAAEIKPKLNIVFFPYKASMWDSLESIYEAAAKDSNCVAKVVPIPYYQLSNDNAFGTYEGDFFPSHIPITHYNAYSLENEQPDIIYVHNIYDEYNTLTRVHEMYFTSNLKQYTEMLVYVPYHVSSFVLPVEGDRSMAYDIPTIKNVDKVIIVNEPLKQMAIRSGVPEGKLLAMGSPKLDALNKALNTEIEYPLEWRERIAGKTVYLINTEVMFFASNVHFRLEWLTHFFNIPRIDNDSIIIWRPHPLTQISVMKYSPNLTEYYVNLTDSIRNKDPLYKHIILDESADYIPALMAADVMITHVGSLLISYLLTEKKVLFWGDKMPENSLVPSNAFYYAFNPNEPWYELVKSFSAGNDPLAENRKGLASKIYVNSDGSSGAKIYQEIKDCVL
ncbi:hypothetical protein [Cohnella soli]|uniref:CDP-Glycerol:Poly(Glycerophosphate) glycerophosphotransferase n=1 Tax=Cohnella soli TaxID=425005 RepID=A0ABW0HL75_9BACL